MKGLPSAEELREQLSGLDQRQKKIVAGMLSLMIQNSERVREREWISEQFTQVTLLAGGFSESGEAHAGLEEVQSFVRDHIDELLNASFALFAQVAADMATREGFDAQDALEQGLTYL